MHQQGQADLDITVRRKESHFRTKGPYIMGHIPFKVGSLESGQYKT